MPPLSIPRATPRRLVPALATLAVLSFESPLFADDAEAARERFRTMDPMGRAALLRFLESL
jgi:hypothetical protein